MGKAGRPKGSLGGNTIQAQKFREYLIKKVIKEKGALVTALLSKGKKGDIMAIRELFDRAFGRSKENVELTGLDGGPVELKHEITETIAKIYGANRTTNKDGV